MGEIRRRKDALQESFRLDPLDMDFRRRFESARLKAALPSIEVV